MDDWASADWNDDSVLNAVIPVAAPDGKGDDVVQTVALDEDDSEGEELNQGATNEPKPKRDDKVKGPQTYAALKKKAANKAKQAGKEQKAAVRQEMTPAELKARQRELEEQSDMMAAADTFGFEVDPGEAAAAAAAAPVGKTDMFEQFDPESNQEGYGKFAAKLSSKLLELQGNLHYMHLVTELSKNLCTAMSVEEIADVVAAMEVVKSAKRQADKGGKKKKKGPALAKSKQSAARQDMVDDEYDSFL